MTSRRWLFGAIASAVLLLPSELAAQASQATADGNKFIAATLPIENNLMQTKIKGSEAFPFS